MRHYGKFLPFIPYKKLCTKALQCVRLRASFTVEAAFTVPLFLFAAVIVLGLFQLLTVEIRVAEGLQYASRRLAAACVEQEDDTAVQQLAMAAEGRLLVQSFLKEHEFQAELVHNGLPGISFAQADFTGEYVTLRASYRVNPPLTFWGIRNFPVAQCVRSRKWIGASPESGEGEENGYVFVTPEGNAYHRSASCPYLDLSVRSVSIDDVKSLRSRDGSIYRRCGCCRDGQTTVYVTNYGTQYHGSLSCGDLKRTVYKVRPSDAGGRHACAKCCGGE